MKRGIRVLYVDDEPDLLGIAKIFLEKIENFQVVTLTSAKYALESPEISSYDLILSDYQMPDMDGISFLKEIRHRYGDIPFILFTGRGREEVVIDAINNGADFYLQKGGDPKAQFAELAHKIRIAVERNRTTKALEESEEKYRSLVNIAPLAILVHREGIIAYANPECVRLAGAGTPDELIGTNIIQYIHPEDHAMAREHLRLMKEKGVMIPLVEERLLGLDGRPFTVEITARPVIYLGLPSIFVVFRDITDRKKKEDELRAAYEQIAAAEEELRSQYEDLGRVEKRIRESEERYRNIIVNSPYGMHFYELKPGRGLVFVGANPGADRLLNISHDCFIGKTIEEVFPALASTEVPERYREVAESGTVWHTEQTYIQGSISGTYAVTAFRTAPGSMAAMFVDITERRRMEETLRENEELLRLFIDHAPAALAMLDRELRYIAASSRWITDYHLVGRNLLGQSHLEIFPELTGEIKDVLHRGLAGETTSGNEDPFVRYDGSVQWLAWEVRPWYTAGHDVGGVIIFSEDVTKRKNTEDALRESEEKYRRILENLQDGYFRGDERGIVTMANSKAARMFNYDSPDELIGMSVVSVYSRAEDRDAILQLLQDKGEVTDYLVEGLRKDGTTFWGSLNAQFIRDEGGRVLGTEGIVRDISGRTEGKHMPG